MITIHQRYRRTDRRTDGRTDAKRRHHRSIAKARSGNYCIYLKFVCIVASSVDGGWSDWSHLDACSATPCSQEIGFRIRFRSCTSPSPMFGGLPCQGRSWKRETCYNNDFCTKPGTFVMRLFAASVIFVALPVNSQHRRTGHGSFGGGKTKFARILGSRP